MAKVPVEIERLYREHRAGLVRLVERELRDHHDAEDVVQTAFLDAQRALERGTIPRNPRAWLSAIALNAAHRLRRRRVNAEPLEDYAVQEALGVSELRAALASLPKEQRAAVLYRDVLGLSYGETADQMGTSVNAVTMLLHRGRKRLRQTLGVTTAGVGLGRWFKRVGMPQVTAVKGAAAVVAAGGLATAGIVAARVVAPIGSDATAAVATHAGSPAARAVRPPVGRLAFDSARRLHKTAVGSRRSASAAASSPAAAVSAPSSQLAPTLGVPTVSLPKLAIPTLPVTVAATVTVSTPVATVTAPLSTTATVTTPITTITLPIP
jgi:RNA polymerase sigma-70 factor (ECF subfamily)